jgi:PAS domain S-box-containing protein
LSAFFYILKLESLRGGPFIQNSYMPTQPELDITKLRALVNHIPAAIYRCRGDAHLTLEFFSDEVEKLTGYPVSYFLSDRQKGYSGLILPEDWPRLQAAMRTALANKERYEIEYRIRHKSGEERWVFERGKAVYDEDDNVSYVDGCLFDITRRKNTEAALARSKDEVKRLALVAHNTTNSVMIADADEKIIWVNEGYLRMSEYSMPELLEKKIGYSLEGPGFDPEVYKRIQNALAEKKPFKEEFVSHTKEGKQLWLEVDCHPLKDEYGNHIGFMAIETDITQRRNTLRQQEELLQRLTLATDSAEIGIFEIDLVTNEVIWDERMYEIYGYSRQTELSLYKVFGKALHPDDRELMNKVIGELLSNKKEIDGAVYRIIRPDGQIRYIESHAIIKKSESGRVLSLIGTNRDVTTEFQVQERLRSQNKALRDIAFIQSHEVRKPLANILGMIEILKQTGTINDLEIFQHLADSAQELDQQIRSIVSKTNTLDDELFR